jgi:hypothetical protein
VKWLQGHLKFVKACGGKKSVQDVCWDSALKSWICAVLKAAGINKKEAQLPGWQSFVQGSQGGEESNI